MITQELLKELVIYNKDTGIFFSKEKRGRIKAGSVAGTTYQTCDGLKYIRIGLLKKYYLAHRIAWLYHYGEWPNVIDHINGDGTDNRIINLRDVTQEENAKNVKRHKTNKTGLSGVSYYLRESTYVVRIGKKYIGRYKVLLDAASARISAEKLFRYHENHGNR